MHTPPRPYRSLSHHLLVLLLLLTLTHLTPHAQTGTPIPKLAPFDTAMTALLAQYHVPGGQLAITYHGKLVYSRGFGLADSANHTQVQPNSVFRLASLSKPLTAITILHLVEAGKLGLDDTVFGAKGILKDTTWGNIKDPRVLNITVRHLLEHSAGWNRDVSGDYVFMAYEIAKAMGVPAPADPVTVIRWTLQQRMLDVAPGTQYHYSNLGFSILGRIIEKLTGRKYEDYVRAEILQPLGITAMRLGLNRIQDRLPNEVTYYGNPNAGSAPSVYDGATPVPWPYGGFNLEAFDSFGRWTASAEDLCRLLLAADGFPSVPDLLSPASIAAMSKPSATNANYALGWAVNPANNWWHIGSLPGTTTEIVRANNQMNWAILFNTRPDNSAALENAMDQLVWNVIPKIAAWPDSAVTVGVVGSGRELGRAGDRAEFVVRGGVVRIPVEANSAKPHFTLVDMNGMTESVVSARVGGDWVLDLKGQARGIHFLSMRSREESRVVKILVE